jgi:large subunit ribosomal protein L29
MSVKKWVKQEKLRELTVQQLADRVAELKGDVYQHRVQRSTGQLENFRLMPRDRHRLAAVLTILREKQTDNSAGKAAKEARK